MEINYRAYNAALKSQVNNFEKENGDLINNAVALVHSMHIEEGPYQDMAMFETIAKETSIFDVPDLMDLKEFERSLRDGGNS